MIGTFRQWANALDDWMRFTDIRWQRMGADGHNADAYVWPSLVAAALWTGMPALGWHLAIGVVVGLAAWAIFRWGRRHLLLVQVAVLGLLDGGIWIFGGDQAKGDGKVYQHLLIPVTAIVGLALLLAARLARSLMAPLAEGSTYRQGLAVTELFQSRGRSAAVGRALIWQVITGLFGSALLLLLPAAIAVLLAPPAYTFVAGAAVLGTMALLVVFTALNERLYAMLRILTARFFRNAALGVSLLLIALGGARMAEVTYVTTIFDGAAGLEIVLYLGFAYALTWWYDYWMERLVGGELLGLLGEGTYEIPYSYAGPAVTKVPADQRTVALHGLGRFVAYRPNPAKPEEPYFEAWTFRDFFVHVAATGNPGGKAEPKPRQIDRRLSQYFAAIGLLVAALLGGGAWWLSRQTQIPGLVAAAESGRGRTLAELVGCGGGPRIVVAASGGGTRAALFTAAVLEGITQRAPEGSVVAGSGVSGGSAALAYYAGRRPELVRTDEAAWDRFYDTMDEPYIRDVIERASEWRMVAGGRLGILLADSFDRRWGLEQRRKMGDVEDFGLILNTTLAGRFRREEGHPKDMRLAELASARFGETKSDVAGGRLVLTNLKLRPAFPRTDLPFVPKEPLPVLVDDPATRLVDAAALSANFPPVFSNAAVDVGERTRYWVTDGGAADNRGLEMLLFALRTGQAACPSPPEIHVVVIEASGVSERFSQDRGIGSAMGAGAQFAGQLNVELARQLPGVRFHMVAMPLALRTSGSFGTHWMLQPYIAVKTQSGQEVFAGQDVVAALRQSYGCRALSAPEKLRAVVTETEEFRVGWCQLAKALGRAGCECAP